MKSKSLKKNKGFTLIELLVVISIIGLLASIVLVSLKGVIQKAKFARLTLEARQVAIAAERYNIDYGEYAPDVSGGVDPAFVPDYLSEWPSVEYLGATYIYDWNNWKDITVSGKCSPLNHIVQISIYPEGYGGGPDEYIWCILEVNCNCEDRFPGDILNE